jgi:hypothetical protein
MRIPRGVWRIHTQQLSIIYLPWYRPCYLRLQDTACRIQETQVDCHTVIIYYLCSFAMSRLTSIAAKPKMASMEPASGGLTSELAFSIVRVTPHEQFSTASSTPGSGQTNEKHSSLTPQQTTRPIHHSGKREQVQRACSTCRQKRRKV